MLGHRGLYNRDPRLAFSPYISPLGGGRDLLDPLARLGRGAPVDLLRGGALGRGPLGAGVLGGGALGLRGRAFNPYVGNRGALGMVLRGDPLNLPLERGRHGLGLDHRLLPYDRYRGGGWPLGANCDTFWRERSYHENQGYHGLGCGCRPSCGETLNSSSKGDFEFKTKDVTIRGKARAVKASYLTDTGKFEADLTKYMEKKSEEEIPDRVVDMLISFINRDRYDNNSLLDEVKLNILASNVGAKSAVDYSLGRLKQSGLNDGSENICKIIPLITQSGKVDAGRKKWLEKELKADDRWLYDELNRDVNFLKLCQDFPEAVVELERIMGDRTGGDGYVTL
jgi:hypothetical protein